MTRGWFAVVIALCAGCAPGGTGAGSRPAVSPPNLQPVELRQQAIDGSGDTFVFVADAVDLDESDGAVEFELVAAPTDDTHFRYAYNGQVPGPTLRARVGDTFTVRLRNELDAPTSIHWHGLDVPFAMDGGVPHGSASNDAGFVPPVPAGGSRTYTFTVNQAGTFWYHPHFDTDAQVDGGLYGAIVVEEADAPQLYDLVVILDDASVELEAPRLKADDHTGTRGGVGADGPLIVNGKVEPQVSLPSGAAVRVRFVNASNTRYAAIAWPGMRVIAFDQGLLGTVLTPPRVVLAPGDRMEAELLVGNEPIEVVSEPYTLRGGDAWGDESTLFTVVPIGEAEAPAATAWPSDVLAPTVDTGETAFVYGFAGSDSTGQWLINGELYPDVTIESVVAGTTPTIEVRNLSGTEHPFHTHGMRFEVLSINGIAPAFRQIEDTINLAIRDVARLRLLPQEPGVWMTHCHILPHAEEGMMTLIEVTR